MTDDDDMVKAIPGGSCLRKPSVIRGGGHYNNIGEMKRPPENGAGFRQYETYGKLSTSGGPCFHLIYEHHGENRVSFLPSEQRSKEKKKISLE